MRKNPWPSKTNKKKSMASQRKSMGSPKKSMASRRKAAYHNRKCKKQHCLKCRSECKKCQRGSCSKHCTYKSESCFKHCFRCAGLEKARARARRRRRREPPKACIKHRRDQQRVARQKRKRIKLLMGAKKCRAVTKKGSFCENNAKVGSNYCYISSHSGSKRRRKSR